MSICLSHSSADRVLELCAQKGLDLEPVSSSVLAEVSANRDEVSEALGNVGIFARDEIELAVGRRQQRRSSGLVTSHLWSTRLPEGAIFRVDEGLFVSSPAFCLLQQAAELHALNLAQMLGRYYAVASPDLLSEKTDKLVRRAPLVTEEKLAAFLRETRGVRGRAALLEVMGWTCPNAASPQETNLQIALTAPRSLGGFSLSLPEMNHKVTLGKQARHLYKHEKIYIDLYWKERFGLEFQGEEHGNQLGADYARFLAADAEGVLIWFVAKDQLHDAHQMDYIARFVESKTPGRAVRSPWPSNLEVQNMLDILAGKIVPKQGTYQRHRSR